MTEISDDLSMALVPNPTDGKFTIEIAAGKQQTVQLTVLNYLGQLVADLEKFEVNGRHTVTYDLSLQEAGIYFVMIQNGKNRIVRKLVIKN
jgi:hypothetical protein